MILKLKTLPNGSKEYTHQDHPELTLIQWYDIGEAKFVYNLSRFIDLHDHLGAFLQSEILISDDELYDRIFLPLKARVDRCLEERGELTP